MGAKPINKVSFGFVGGGGGAMLIAWIYAEMTGKAMPVEIAVLLAAGLQAAIAYLTPLEAGIRAAWLKQIEEESGERDD